MNISLNQILGVLLGWAERRFWLIVIPLVLSVPLSIAAALLLPQKFVATTLLLMQEATTENPFARQLRAAETPADKLGALQALLFSERNLNDVLVELRGPQIMKDARALHLAREELKRALSIAPSGPEFIVIRYVSNNPAGMGKTLSVILARLLETLLKNDIDAPVAPEIVKARMKERLSELEVSISALKSSPLLEEIVRTNLSDASTLKKMLQDVQSRHGSLAPASKSAPKQHTNAADDQLLPTIGATSAVAETRATTPKLSGGESDRLRQEVAFLQALIERPNSNPSALYSATLLSLEKRLETAKQAHASWTERYGNLHSSGLSFMRAPERIIVIDPPRDPEVAQVGRSFAAILGLAGGVVLALGLGLLGELLDRRVRTVEQLRAITGVEVLARLPKPR